MVDELSDAMDLDEPDWMTNNRIWYSQHQELSTLKYSPAALEGWVQTAPAFPDESEDLDIDFLFTTKPKPPEKTFIAAMDVAEAPDLERMGVDRLFNEDSEQPKASFSDCRRKYWTKEEELALSEFLGTYAQAGRVPKQAWAEVSRSMRRSQCSVVAKAAQIRRFGLHRNPSSPPDYLNSDSHPRKSTLEDMITEALNHLPNHEGSKVAIIATIESLHPDIATGRSGWKNSVKQILSSAFEKVPGIYRLKAPGVVLVREKCARMQEFIVYALQQGCQTLQEIKAVVRTQFGKWLNETVNPDSSLCVWEKTLLKKLKTSPFIDHDQATPKFRKRKER